MKASDTCMLEIFETMGKAVADLDKLTVKAPMLSTIEEIAPYNTENLIKAFNGKYYDWMDFMHYSIGYIKDDDYEAELRWLDDIRRVKEVM